MKPFQKAAASLAAFLVPGIASAAQMQFVVHNAFDETVSALQRLALVVSDPVFMLIAGSLIAATMLFAAMFFSAKGMAKEATNPTGFLIQGAAGLALFFGAVVPKGTLYVYDDVLNKNQAVGSIPDIIVLVAGVTNAIERELTRVVDTAAATPYGTDVGATTFQLLYALSRGKQGDSDLERTIGQYVKDCGLTAIGTGQNGATMSELLRSSPDLKDTLEKYKHPSWPTTYYPTNQSGGVPGTCNDAWTYLNGKLTDTASGNARAYMKDVGCRESGFNTSDPQADARCDSVILEAAKLFGSTPASSPVFINNFIISKGIQNMMMSSEFAQTQSVLVNRSMIAEGMGATEALNQWVPRIRALMLSICLGIIPIPLLFLGTQLVYKAAGVVFGLFVMLTMWGVTDAISVAAARDAAATVFASMKNQHFGYESMMLVPTASMQALAMYGKYRISAMAIAFALTGALFKFSASGFGKGAEVAGEDLTSKGGDAGTNTLTPEGFGSTMGSLNNSMAAPATSISYGAGTAMGAGAQGSLQGGATMSAMARYLQSGAISDGVMPEGMSGMEGLNAGVGANRAADAIGGVASTGEVARNSGKSFSDTALGASTARGTFDKGEILARDQSATELFGAGGLAKSAEFSGISSSAVNAADSHLSDLKEGGSLTERVAGLRRQERGATEGLALAEPSNDKIVGAYKTESEQRLGRLDEVGKHGARDVGGGQGINEAAAGLGGKATERDVGFGGMVQGARYHGDLTAATGKAAEKHGGGIPAAANTVGTGNFQSAYVGAKATSNVWNALGSSSMVRGEEFAKAGTAYTGAAAGELGLYKTAKETRENDLANSVGAARVSAAVGEQFGLNPDHIKDRLNVAQMRQGQVGMVLDEAGKATMAERGLANGTFNQAQADMLRSSPGTTMVNFGIDKDGRIGSIKADSLSNVTEGHTTVQKEGADVRIGDEKVYGNRTAAGDSVTANNALFFAGKDTAVATRQMLGDTLPTGKLSGAMGAQIASIYSTRAQQEGAQLGAQVGQQSSDQGNFNAGAGIFAGMGGPSAGEGKGPSAGGTPGANVRAGAGYAHTETWTNGHTATSNSFTTGMESAVRDNWSRANVLAERTFGDRSAWTPETRREAEDFIVNNFAGANENSYQILKSHAVDKTYKEDAAAQGHNTLADKWESTKSTIKELF